MTTLLKTVSSHANPEDQKANCTQPPVYLRLLLSPEIQQAIYEMSDHPAFSYRATINFMFEPQG